MSSGVPKTGSDLGHLIIGGPGYAVLEEGGGGWGGGGGGVGGDSGRATSQKLFAGGFRWLMMTVHYVVAWYHANDGGMYEGCVGGGGV